MDIHRTRVAVVQSVRRRRPLPTGRAALGGLLVAVAAMGAFAAASGAAEDRRLEYVVARSDLAVGQRIARGDLAVGRMDLPEFVRKRAFRPSEADGLVGSLVLGPVARGELVQSSVLRRGAPDGRQVSFAVDPARAVGGGLQPGEFVDVVATVDATTSTVVRSARVASVRDRGGLGAAELVVTLDVASEEQAVAVARAVDAGEVTLVRSGPPS